MGALRIAFACVVYAAIYHRGGTIGLRKKPFGLAPLVPIVCPARPSKNVPVGPSFSSKDGPALVLCEASVDAVRRDGERATGAATRHPALDAILLLEGAVGHGEMGVFRR